MAKLEPATDIDPNVWYHMTEENVDDYDGDFKSMLQTWEDGDFRVFPVAKRKTYWQFVSSSQARCSTAFAYPVRSATDRQGTRSIRSPMFRNHDTKAVRRLLPPKRVGRE